MKRYKHMVFTVAKRIVRDQQEAEEVSQDVFVKAYQNLKDYQGGSKFSTWLYSIAYRTAISQLRKRRDAGVALDEAPMDDRSLHVASVEPVHDRRKAVELALAQLPAEDAAVVTFYYLQEMNVDEIVTATGLSASNVKVKLHRSRKRMLEVLSQHLQEETWTLVED